jgi:hypothetical protein
MTAIFLGTNEYCRNEFPFTVHCVISITPLHISLSISLSMIHCSLTLNFVSGLRDQLWSQIASGLNSILLPAIISSMNLSDANFS